MPNFASKPSSASSPRSCWQCAKRRLVCDLGKPGCKKCATHGVECPGYETKPLQWMQPGQTRSKGARKTERLRFSRKPAIQAAKDKSTTLDTGRTTPKCLLPPKYSNREEALIVYPMVTDKSAFSLLIQALNYHNINISPDLVATGDRSPDNLFIVAAGFVSVIPPVIAEVIICTALGHRMVQCVQGFEADRNAMAVKLRRHRGAAISAVASGLSHQEAQWHDRTLISVVLLLLSEIQHSLSPNWWQHLDGAYALIDMRGGLPYLIRSMPRQRHLFRYFFHIDVFGATTAPCVDVRRVQQQLSVVGHLKTLYGDGLLTSTPCPPELVSCIIFTNYLRSQQRSLTSSSLSDSFISLEDSYHPLQQILAFDPQVWASSLSLHKFQGFDPEDRHKHLPPSWNWTRIGRIYQSAVALYCVESLGPRPSWAMPISVPPTVRSCCRNSGNSLMAHGTSFENS
uniref:Zn(2)-C6 fungal-type domain-containing protein n=1 Tax=Bionectria ochroleuca TaxID=29856 RepID=A0A8H7NPU0_BIOOC